MQIHEVTPTPETLVDQAYVQADYRDAFLVPTAHSLTIEQFATAYFLNQPRWLSMLSMNLLSRDKLIQAVGDESYPEGDSVGSWKVHGRSDDEIVFGDDMGFMEYLFSFRLTPEGDIEASTAVRYRWQHMSKLYFGIVKPMHRRFVPLTLRSAVRYQEVAA